MHRVRHYYGNVCCGIYSTLRGVQLPRLPDFPWLFRFGKVIESRPKQRCLVLLEVECPESYSIPAMFEYAAVAVATRWVRLLRTCSPKWGKMGKQQVEHQSRQHRRRPGYKHISTVACALRNSRAGSSRGTPSE